MRIIVLVLALAAGQTVLAASPAAAGTLSAVVAAIEPVIAYAVSALAVVIVGWLSELARRWFGKAIEQKDRDALQAALENAAGVVLNQIRGRPLAGPLRVTDPLVSTAVDYVQESVPDAVRSFGLRPAVIAEKIIAKVALAIGAGPGPAKPAG